jgi:alpha-glutamyl/putrescinyl thymine pyrophosphorylase-like protein
MPTFCRHNRFLERCPICSKTLPGQAPGGGSTRRAASTRGRPRNEAGRGRAAARPERLRVRREGRAEDDGYRSTLVPGLRASADASRLAEEIAFSSARLLTLGREPPALYGEIRALAAHDPERATWACFLIAYLSPLEGEDPFAGIRRALAGAPTLDPDASEQLPSAGMPDLADIPLGPRTSHDPARGAETLIAYRQWVRRAAGQDAALADPAHAAANPAASQSVAFRGDPAWSPQRRFERLFERLALPGFGRMGRYDLLITLGYLGIYELRPDSLHLAGARGLSGSDSTTLAAKRVFGIGDPLVLERRAAALADAVSVPLETLDLALANWSSPQRATLGFPPQTHDRDALERAGEALAV